MWLSFSQELFYVHNKNDFCPFIRSVFGLINPLYRGIPSEGHFSACCQEQSRFKVISKGDKITGMVCGKERDVYFCLRAKSSPVCFSEWGLPFTFFTQCVFSAHGAPVTIHQLPVSIGWEAGGARGGLDSHRTIRMEWAGSKCSLSQRDTFPRSSQSPCFHSSRKGSYPFLYIFYLNGLVFSSELCSLTS